MLGSISSSIFFISLPTSPFPFPSPSPCRSSSGQSALLTLADERASLAELRAEE